MREPLEIVYATDHSYLLLCGVSILSLMENLPDNQPVNLHLLLDESFCAEDRRLLAMLEDRFQNLNLL